MNYLISSQSSNGNIINVSGKQRMLSQQISLNAIYYKTKALKEAIEEMEKNHNYLISMPMTQELKELYFKSENLINKNKQKYINSIAKEVKVDTIQEPAMLDKRVKQYIKEAKNFLETRSGKSLTYLLQNSKILLKYLDKATQLYVKKSEENSKSLKQRELLLYILTLITLLFEALFIFKPANKKIIDDTKIITQQKDYSNTVIETSTNAIITLDKELKIKRFNKKAQEIFGYKKEELLNKKYLSQIIPSFKIDNIEEFLKLFHTTNMYKAQEKEGVDKKGYKFPIRVSFGISENNNNIIIVVNIENIAQEKLKDKIVQEQAKFAALGEMIAVIAHQWRQPLAQLNFNNLYIKKLTNNKEIIQESKNNEDIITFMSETISNFENFYKKSEETEFNPIISVEQALKIVDSIIKLKEIKVIKTINSKAKIYANPNALAQVILSILQNALDVIKLRKIKNPYIKIVITDKKKYIEIIIEDNAGGIKEEPIENIFKPFISKKTKPSTGIGLYMSKMVIKEKFNGIIKAENSAKGALFKIILPYKN